MAFRELPIELQRPERVPLCLRAEILAFRPPVVAHDRVTVGSPECANAYRGSIAMARSKAAMALVKPSLERWFQK